jgi:hypothetical protein
VCLLLESARKVTAICVCLSLCQSDTDSRACRCLSLEPVCRVTTVRVFSRHETVVSSQHVLTASSSTVTYDQAEHCPIQLYMPTPYEPGLIARLLGAVLEAAHAYGGVRLLRK